MAFLIPAEREHDLLLGHDLDVFASGLELARHQDAVDAAGSGVDLGDGAVPLDVLARFGEERPDGLRRGVDHDLANEFTHLLLPFFCRDWSCAASATSRSRSRPEVQ